MTKHSGANNARIPTDSIIAYEAADGFLVLACGSTEEMAHAKDVLGKLKPAVWVFRLLLWAAIAVASAARCRGNAPMQAQRV